MAVGFQIRQSDATPEMSSPSSRWPVSDVRSTPSARLVEARDNSESIAAEMSPPRGSILMTSAPRSASISVGMPGPKCGRLKDGAGEDGPWTES